MFEFTIRSTKNVKEFSVKFDDGEIVHSENSELDSNRTIKESNTTDTFNSNSTVTKDSNERDELLDISDFSSSKPNNKIIQKPEIPDVVVNVDPNLHNLNL